MTGGHALLVAGAVILAIWLAYCCIGWMVRLVDRPGWYVAVAVGLWLSWEIIPGSHAVMGHLWADLQRQAGQAVGKWL